MTTRRFLGALALVVTVVIGAAAPAGAGGWAVTTLDAVPSPRRGETVEVGFVIRQHGVHPADDMDDVAIELTLPDGDVVRFAARSEGDPGHYVADVTFPDADTVRWSVAQGWFGAQDLGSLQLAEPEPSSSGRVAAALAAGLVVAVVAWALPMVPRRRRQLAPA